jgi:hypothetical protein
MRVARSCHNHFQVKKVKSIAESLSTRWYGFFSHYKTLKIILWKSLRKL